jgi:RNA 2',3'-cyclic 3'-phosphodiesterase
LRLFTGISLNYAVRRNLELLLQMLQPLAPLRWQPADNFHITNCFLGECPEAQVPALASALAQLPRPEPFALRARGFRWFPNPHQPASLAVAVDEHPAPTALQEATATLARSIGLNVDTRPLVPHITIARIAPHTDVAPIRRAIAELPANDFGLMQVEKFLLYQSSPGPDASRYSVRAEFPL